MPIDLLSGMLTGMCHRRIYPHPRPRHVGSSKRGTLGRFFFSFFFFGMCHLRHLFTLLKGQVHVGKVAMEAYCNTYTYMYLP